MIQVHIYCLVFCTFLISEFSCIPIFNSDENLSSIVISELDLPTESSILSEKENSNTESNSFVDLYEKYDELFIKNSSVVEIPVDENPLKKRNSLDDDSLVGDVNSKSLIDKIQIIDDPEVRKEFEVEIANKGQIPEVESENVSEGTEYDPNYARKIVNLPEKPFEVVNESENSVQDITDDESTRKLSLHEKEVLQGHLVEQLVHMNESNVEYTTIIPEGSFTHHENIKNPEVVEVLEHIVYQSENFGIEDVTTINPLNLQVDFDPIEIIPKDRHRFRNIEDEVTTTTEKNDKFVGFKPSEDLVAPGEETTESDQFFKKENAEDDMVKTAEAIVETLEYVGLYGKNLKYDAIEVTTTEASEKIDKEVETVAPSFETVTEIVEVNTQISVNIQIENSSSKHSSSSEESNDSKSSEQSNKSDKDSGESSEENSAKEVTDKDDFKMLNLRDEKDQKSLMEDLFVDASIHEIKKKDHVEELSLPNEIVARKFSGEQEIESKTVNEATTVGIYETFEDVVTTVSDGIKLTNDLRSSIYSFRGVIDESKTVLDTNSEAISSKNIKNNLVNIAEEMKLENHPQKAGFLSYFVVSVFAIFSIFTVVFLYAVLNGNFRLFH